MLRHPALVLLVVCLFAGGLVKGDDVLVGGAGFASIAEAVQNATSGDTIILTSGASYPASVVISINLTFQTSSGLNDVVIEYDDSLTNNYIFSINGNSDVVFNYITFNASGIAAKTSGCIQVFESTLLFSGVSFFQCSSGVLNLKNSGFAIRDSNFFTNTNNMQSGGVVYCISDNGITPRGEISGCNFTGNSAAGGGAVYNWNCNISSTGDGYYGNQETGGYGGAIYNNKYFQLVDTTFEGNGQQIGGAIANTGSMTVSSSSFTQNRGHLNGGAIFNQGSIVVDSSSFFKNTAQGGGCGGAIFSTGSITTLTSTFDSNLADSGAAICALPYFDLESNFTNNQATDTGGAMYFSKGSGEPLAVLNASHILSNSAQDGGAIYLDIGTQLRLSSCLLYSNNASEGGAIFSSSFVADSGSYFVGNRAKSGSGGAVYLDSNGNISLTDTTFQSNQAANNGGAIANFGALTSQSSSYVSNSATEGGAVFNSLSIMSSWLGNQFISNTATSAGAGVYCLASVVADEGSLFELNSAQDGGGFYSVASNITITNSSFDYNSASRNGGGAYFESGQAVLNGTSFICNNAAVDGDAYFTNTSTGLIFSCDCSLDRNGIDCDASTTTTGTDTTGIATTTGTAATTGTATTTGTTTRATGTDQTRTTTVTRTPGTTQATTRTATTRHSSSASQVFPSGVVALVLMLLIALVSV